MFFLFYKFLFFFSDFLEIQRKSFYLFLNIKLGEEFSKIQPLHNSQKRTLYKNYKGLSTKENLPNFSLQTKNFMKSSSEFFNQNRNAIDFSYPSLTNTDAHSDVSIAPPKVPPGTGFPPGGCIAERCPTGSDLLYLRKPRGHWHKTRFILGVRSIKIHFMSKF